MGHSFWGQLRMFERFKQRYAVTSRLSAGLPDPIVTSPLENTPGYEDFMREHAGATFNEGVYRVHSLEARARLTCLVEQAYPMYRGQFAVFGCDWLGRQFALDSQRRENGQPLVVMYEPGTGQALEIPATFQGFHDEVLSLESDAALADVFFQDWLRAGHRGPRPAECVGYKVPLFLNGEDTIDNLELTAMELSWELTAQLLAKTRGLPAGTPIRSVEQQLGSKPQASKEEDRIGRRS